MWIFLSIYSASSSCDVPVRNPRRGGVLDGFRILPDAEILINGATARLGDFLVDDLVRVTGRAEKRDGETRYIATKVEVIRPPTTAPSAATQLSSGDSKTNK